MNSIVRPMKKTFSLGNAQNALPKRRHSKKLILEYYKFYFIYIYIYIKD